MGHASLIHLNPGQIVPPHDSRIIQEVRNVQSMDAVRWAVDSDLQNIHLLGAGDDEAYLKTVQDLSLHAGLRTEGSDMPLVYTPLHGTGSASVIPALKHAGFRNVPIVESQRDQDTQVQDQHHLQ